MRVTNWAKKPTTSKHVASHSVGRSGTDIVVTLVRDGKTMQLKCNRLEANDLAARLLKASNYV